MIASRRMDLFLRATTMAKMSFAKRLKQLRKGAGLSRYALAKQTGMSLQAISYLEQGEREPTWDTVRRLAAALGTNCLAFDVDEEPKKGGN